MRWISYLNLALIAAILSVGLFFFFLVSREPETLPSLPRIERKELPPSPFSVIEGQELDEGAFSLTWVPPLMQLPDLREELQFFGQNGRPDAGRRAYHIGLKSSGEYTSIEEGERLYLIYQGNFSIEDKIPIRERVALNEKPLWGEVTPSNKGSYLFSPGNQPTPLWIECCSKGNGSLSLQVSMLDEKGGLVKTPPDLRLITLHNQEFPKTLNSAWELGGGRVDSTLLVRQKARWIGRDRFLEMHGGEDFSFAKGRERIDFYHKDTPYFCFIGPQDFLIWKKDRWVNPLPGEETQGYPLLAVKKVDEKLMSLELWDAGGRVKTPLSLMRIKDHQKNPNLNQEFKFVGAKTWAQFIVECSREKKRLTLKSNDWLVLTQEGWKKLETPDEIDAYVSGSLSGPLFILDHLKKQNGRQVLFGHVFNTSRTEVEEIEIAASSHNTLANFCRTIPALPPIKPQLEGNEE